MTSLILSLFALAPSAANLPTTPSFVMRPWGEGTEAVIEVKISAWTEDLGFEVREKTEIQIGDLIRAVVKNPKTDKNISESNEIKVQY